MMASTQKVKLVADVALFSGNDVLLIRYQDTNKYDHQPGWFLPDDLVADREHPEHAATRVLDEQLGLAVRNLILDHIESFTGNDRTWHLVFHFRADLLTRPEIVPSRELSESAWFDLNALPLREETAHYGWALGTVEKMRASAV